MAARHIGEEARLQVRSSREIWLGEMGEQPPAEQTRSRVGRQHPGLDTGDPLPPEEARDPGGKPCHSSLALTARHGPGSCVSLKEMIWPGREVIHLIALACQLDALAQAVLALPKAWPGLRPDIWGQAGMVRPQCAPRPGPRNDVVFPRKRH